LFFLSESNNTHEQCGNHQDAFHLTSREQVSSGADKHRLNCGQYSVAPPLAQLDFAAIIACGGDRLITRAPRQYPAIQVFLSESNNYDAGFVIGKNDITFTQTL